MKKFILVFILANLNIIHAQYWLKGNGPYGTDVRHLLSAKNDYIYFTSLTGIYRSTNFCETWERVFNEGSLGQIFESKSGALFINGYKSTDQGVSWSYNFNNGILAQNSRNEIFSAGGPKIFKSADDGETWTEISRIENEAFLNSIAIDKKGVVYIGTQTINGEATGNIYKSNDDGLSWNKVLDYTKNDFGIIYKVTTAEDNSVYASTLQGLIKSSDEGLTWHKLISGINYDMVLGENGRLYCAMDGCFAAGGVMISTDNGNTWHRSVNGIRGNNLYCIARTSGNVLVAGTGSSGIYSSTNNGGLWLEKNRGIDGISLKSIFIQDDLLYATGGKGINISSDRGRNWTDTMNTDLMQNQYTYGITGDSKGNVYAGYGSGVYKSTNYGVDWTAKLNGFFPGPLVLCLDIDKNDHIYAATQNSGIYKSTNSGENWFQIFPESKVFHSILVDNSGSIHAGSWEDGIYSSFDAGNTWIKNNEGLPKERIYSIAVNSKNKLFAGTENSGLYSCNEDSKQWEQVDPQLRYVGAIAFNKMDFMFIADGYNIYVSKNYGKKWINLFSSELSHGSFFDINDLECDNEGFLYAVTTNGVYRTINTTFGPPEQPSLKEPVQHSKGVSSNPELEWQLMPGSEYYRLQISMTSEFMSTVIDTFLNSNAVTLTNLQNNSTYYWRIKSVNIYGESEWSQISDFTVRYFDFTSNTGNNAVVGIPSASVSSGNSLLNPGDEIGVFTADGLCVGCGVWDNKDLVITIWGDNDQTLEVDGLKAGEEIYYKIWNHRNASIVDSVYVTYSQGNGRYSPNGIYIISAFFSIVNVESPISFKANFKIAQNVPNPFNASTKITYSLPQESMVDITIYNTLGQFIKKLVNGNESAGNHTIIFDAGNLSSGVYMCVVNAKAKYVSTVFSSSIKLVIMK